MRNERVDEDVATSLQGPQLALGPVVAGFYVDFEGDSTLQPFLMTSDDQFRPAGEEYNDVIFDNEDLLSDARPSDVQMND